jgi:two-component system, LytTR family, response regulator
MPVKNYIMINNAFNEKETLDVDENILIWSYANGKDFIRIDTIVYCEADNTSCNIYLNNGNKHIISQTLEAIENKLPTHKFIKIHDCYMVNVSFINRHKKEDIDYLILHNGTKLEIGLSYKKTILATLALVL